MQQTWRNNKRDKIIWLGWLVASLAGLYQFLLQTSTSVMFADLQKAFSLDAFGVSVLSSSFFYTYLLCQIPAGIIIDKCKPKQTLFICLCGIAFLCVLFASVTQVWMAAFTRIAMGFFCSPFIVAALYLAAHTLPEKKFALFAGLTEALCMLGGVAGEALLARVVTLVGWRETMMILSSASALLAVLAWLLVTDEKKSIALIDKKSVKKNPFLSDLLAILHMPQAWINGLFCGLIFGLIAAFGAFWCIPFLMHIYNMSLHQAADASSMIFVGVFFGAPTLGWLCSRVDRRRLVMKVCTLAALILSLIIVFINVSVLSMFILLLLLGFFSAVYLLSFAVMRDITPPHVRGTVMGFTNMMCILIGAPLLQPLIGWMLASQEMLSIQQYRYVFAVIPVSLAAALLLAFLVREESDTI